MTFSATENLLSLPVAAEQQLIAAVKTKDYELARQHLQLIVNLRYKLPEEILLNLLSNKKYTSELQVDLLKISDRQRLNLSGPLEHWPEFDLWLNRGPDSLQGLAGWPLALAFEQLSQTDPELAWAELMQVWPQLSWMRWNPLLKQFLSEPKPQYLPLLEQCLVSKSKECLYRTIPVLLFLNEPKITEKFRSWITDHLKIETSASRTPRLIVRLPEQYIKEWRHYGIHDKGYCLPSGKSLHIHESYLYQLLSPVPVSLLVKWLGFELNDLPRLIQDTAHSRLLLQALLESACLHQDQPTLLLLWPLLKRGEIWHWWHNLLALEHFSALQQLPFLTQGLQTCLHQPQALADWSCWAEVCCSLNLPEFSVKQARHWLQLLVLAWQRQPTWSDYQIELTAKLAYLMPLDFYPQALQLLQPVLTDERLQRFLALYQKRYQFAAELQPSATVNDANHSSPA